MTTDERQAAAAQAAKTPPRRRRGRRTLFVLSALAALFLLIALAPPILRIAFVRDLVLRWAGARVGMQLAVEDWRLAWFGRQTVEGLEIRGPEGSRLARVGHAELATGLLDLLREPRRLGPVLIEDAEVDCVLFGALAAQAEAPEPPAAPAAPEEPQPAAPLALPSSVRVRNAAVLTPAGTILIAEADFAAGEARDSLRARLHVASAGGTGTVDLQADLEGLSRDWQGPGALGLEATVQCDNVPLAPLVEAATAGSPALQLDGRISGRASLRRQRSGQTHLDTEWEGRDLAASGDALAGDRPALATATLRLQADWADPTLTVGALAFASPVARVSGQGTFDLAALEPIGPAEKPPAVAAEGRMAAQVLLAPLAAMLPHTLGLLEELQVTAGRLDVTLDARTGADGSSLGFSADLADLAATRQGHALAFPPVALTAQVRRDADGLLVDDLRLSAPFASFQGRGRPERFTLDARCDLAGASSQVGQFMDLQGRSAEGTARMHLETDGTFGDGISLVVSAEAENLRLALDDARRLEEPHATFAAAARATFDPQRQPDGLTVTTLAAEGSAGSLAASGSVRRQDDSWTGAAQADGRGDIGPLTRQVAGLLGRPPGDISGRWQLKGDLAADEDGSLEFTMDARATGLAVPLPGQAAEGPPAILALQDVLLSADASYGEGGGRTLAIRRLRATAPGVEADAKGSLDLPTDGGADGLALAGDTSARADLASLEPLLRPFGLLAPGSRLAGSAEATVKATNRAGLVSAEGRLEATGLDLFFAESQTALREAHLSAPFTASYEAKTKRFAFETDGLTSGLVTGSAKAAFSPQEGGRNVEAQADLQFDGTHLAALLGSRLPERMTLGGAWRLTLRVRGPLPDKAPSWNRKIVGLAGEGEVGVATLAWRGLNASGGQLPWKLEAGKLLLGPSADRPALIAVNEGTVRLAGAVDLTPDEARYVLSEPLALADDVHLTDELAEGMLSYVSPLVGQSVSPTGRLALAVRRADIPLGPSVRRLASAEAEFTIRQFKSRLKGPLALLAVWAGSEETVEEQVLGPYPILLSDGRFHLRDQKVLLHRDLVLRMDGTVGLDGTLEALVGVPLTESLLEKFGVRAGPTGPWTDRIVRVPLTGTLSHPRLDEKQLLVEILKMVGETLLTPEKGAEAIEDLLKDILKKPPRASPGNEAPPPDPGAAPSEPGAADQPAPRMQDLIDLFKRPRKESAPPSE